MHQQIIPLERVESRIYLVRGHKVLLDGDLAELYGVQTKALNLAVKRNLDRFPADFMFQLNRAEAQNLRFHFETSRWGGKRYLPYAFTEQGVAMLSSVLRSKRAVQVNVVIMRAFVQLRETLASHKDLTRKLQELEKKFAKHDKEIGLVFQTIQKLLEPQQPPRRRQIGFEPSGEQP